MLMSFIRFGKFLAVMSSNVFPVPFSFFLFFWNPHYAQIGTLAVFLQVFQTLHFLHSFLSCSPDWIVSIMYLISFLILSSSHSRLLFTSLMNFSFQLYFSTPDFLFSFWKNNICLFIDILYLIRYHFHWASLGTNCNLSFTCMGHTSLFLCRHYKFLLIIGHFEIILQAMAPTPVLLPGKSHGWRILAGCSPGGH